MLKGENLEKKKNTRLRKGCFGSVDGEKKEKISRMEYLTEGKSVMTREREKRRAEGG